MTWLELAEFLGRIALQKPAPPVEPPHPGDDTSVRAWEKLLASHRDAIDLLCTEFVFSGRWPEMTPQERWLVHERVGWAWGLCSTLATPASGPAQPLPGQPAGLPMPPHWTREQVLHWLLIETWEIAGEARVAESAAFAVLQKPGDDASDPERPPFDWN